jgi:YHS domain-containing protein
MVSILIRLLALAGLLWTGKQVAHHVSSAIRPRQQKNTASSDQKNSGEMVKDPVCQTYIPKSLAVEKTFEGVTYYFCGHDCAAKFVEQQHAET